MNSSMHSRVGAVVVTFHPEICVLQQLVTTLEAQVEVIYIVDNGSGPDTVRKLRSLARGRNAEVIEFAANTGVAAAQNAGLAKAMGRGLDHVVLFDQDSVPAPDLVIRLCEAHEKLILKGNRAAAVGSLWIDQRSGRRGQFCRIRFGRIIGMDPIEDCEPQEVDFLISSGTLVNLQAARDIGCMREDLFIDHVDTEWCLRAKYAGWKLFGLGSARMRHSLGDDNRRVWLGRWRQVALHSPDRNYYEVRNTLLLLRTPGLDMNWRIAQLTRLTQVVIFYSLMVTPRLRRIARMARGFRDGWLGRGGKLV